MHVNNRPLLFPFFVTRYLFNLSFVKYFIVKKCVTRQTDARECGVNDKAF